MPSTPILAKKLQAYGITMTEHLTVSDGLEQVAAAIDEMRKKPVNMILCTGGMSVDPDDNLTPQQRRVGYLFQQYALFPNMTAAQNIFCGIRTGSRAEKKETLAALLRTFRLEGLEKKLPAQLSGGQQRVALARILASEPQAILLDEPFSALDSYLKWELELELGELLGAFDGPILWVSHELGGSGTPFRILRIIQDAGHAILLLQPEGAAEGSPVLRAECDAAGTYAAGQALPVSFREEKLLFF